MDSVQYALITAGSAATIIWLSQIVHSHILPAFESVTAVLGGL